LTVAVRFTGDISVEDVQSHALAIDQRLTFVSIGNLRGFRCLREGWLDERYGSQADNGALIIWGFPFERRNSREATLAR